MPSLLRGFSAPVKLKGVPLDRLKFLAVHDTEPFARWEAGQEVATRTLLGRVEALRQGAAPAALDPDLVAAMRQTLADAARDPAFAAEALVLPSESSLADQMAVVDVDAIHHARETARAEIGRALAAEFAAAYESSPIPAPTGSMAPRSAGGRCAMPASPISPPPIPTRGRRSPRRSSTLPPT